MLAVAVVLGVSGCNVVEPRLNRIAGDLERPYAAGVSERSRRVHAGLTVADLHADSLLWNRDLAERSDVGHVDVPRLIEGNVALQMFTIVSIFPSKRADVLILKGMVQGEPPWTWLSAPQRTLYQAQRLRELDAAAGDAFTIVRTRRDLDRYLARRQTERRITAGLLGIEGAHALEGDIDNVEAFARAGVRMMGLTHFFDNRVAGSAHGDERYGLTRFGRRVVRAMEREGMMIDLAHVSPAAIDDLLAMHAAGELTRPFVVSHTGVRATADNDRNLSDAHIVAIARTGGVIGIGYFAPALPRADLASICDAIEHVIDLCDAAGLDGASHAALGSDFDGSVAVPFDTTGLVLITDELARRGRDDATIAKVMGENVVRVLRECLPR